MVSQLNIIYALFNKDEWSVKATCSVLCSAPSVYIPFVFPRSSLGHLGSNIIGTVAKLAGSLDYEEQYMLKSMLFNYDFLMWFPIGWRLRHQNPGLIFPK